MLNYANGDARCVCARVKNVLGLAKLCLFFPIPGEAKKRHEGEEEEKKKTEGCESRSGGEKISSERRGKKLKKKLKSPQTSKCFSAPELLWREERFSSKGQRHDVLLPRPSVRHATCSSKRPPAHAPPPSADAAAVLEMKH